MTMLFLTVVFASFTLTLAADEASYICNHVDVTGATPTDKGSIAVTLTLDNAPDAVFAEGQATNCGTGAGAGKKQITAGTGGGTGTPYTITFTLEINDETNCGIDILNPATSSKVTIVASYTFNGVVAATSLTFALECKWNEAKPTFAIKTGAQGVGGAGTATGTSKAFDATALANLAKLQVHDATDANKPEATSLTLNALVGIYVKLDTSGIVKSLKVSELKSNSESDFSTGTPTDLIKAGCGADVTFGTMKLFGSTENCVKIADTDKPSETGHTFYKCGADFKIFRFKTTGNDVYFQATVLVCATAGDTACDTQSCSGRKRRASDTGSTSNRTNTISTLVKVFYKDEFMKYRKDQSAATLSQCVNHVTWLAVVSVLALLLVITLFVALYFGSSVIRSRTAGSKTEYPNPAYKA